MAHTPSQIIWQEAGKPWSFVDDLQDVGEYRCCVCGGREDGRGAHLDDAFTGNEDGWPHFHDRSQEWCCPGCCYLSKGRWKDQFRLWSILYSEAGGLPGHYESVFDQYGDGVDYPVRLEPLVERAGDRLQVTCRGKLDGLLDLLLDPPATPWFAMLTTSGKKKIHRFAPLTAGDPWTIQLDYHRVTSSAVDFAETLYHVASMRALGVSEDRIRDGQLDPSYDRQHAARLSFHQECLDRVRSHPRFELALFCCTKETTHDAGRRAIRALERRRPTRLWRAHAAGHLKKRQHRRHRAERLVATRTGSPPGGGGDERELPTDGEQDVEQARNPGAHQADSPGAQLNLFGVG